jgi:hypothetical protein
VERSLSIGIQMRLPCLQPQLMADKIGKYLGMINFFSFFSDSTGDMS